MSVFSWNLVLYSSAIDPSSHFTWYCIYLHSTEKFDTEKRMATITCFSKVNFKGHSKKYSSDQPDIGKDFHNGVRSAKVFTGPVTLFQGVNYQLPSAQLTTGNYPNLPVFAKSLKV